MEAKRYDRGRAWHWVCFLLWLLSSRLSDLLKDAGFPLTFRFQIGNQFADPFQSPQLLAACASSLAPHLQFQRKRAIDPTAKGRIERL